ncbi:MAG: WYL domain-containing transcriptional regulator [Treponema sp.]|nr:WYL domain-containing transcriptional regulator [Candidatus Treponema merdequi]
MAKKKLREDKVKSLRLLKLERLIKDLNYPNTTRLCKELEVSRATIMRDIAFLQDQYKAPLEFDQKHNGYHFTDNTFFVKREMLSEGELLTVATMLPLMDQYKNTPLESSFKSIYSKLTDMLPKEVNVDSSFINDVQFISDPLPKINVNIFNSIFTAIRQKKSIEFSYRSISATEYTKRQFDPYKVICQKGNWYVIGYCYKHEKFMVYSLSRMKKLSILKTFIYRKDYEKFIHIDPNFGVWNNEEKPQKIELEFSKDVNTYILERSWHKNQVCTQNPDGSVYLSFISNQTQELEHWIMSFGSKVKVISPESLKNSVHSELKKALKNY